MKIIFPTLFLVGVFFSLSVQGQDTLGLNENIQKLINKIEGLEKERDILTKKNQALENDLLATREQKDRLQKSNEELTSTCRDLKIDLESLKAKRQMDQKLLQDSEETEILLKEARKEIKVRNAEVADLLDQVSELESSYVKADKENEELSKSVDMVSVLRKQNQKLEYEVKELERTLNVNAESLQKYAKIKESEEDIGQKLSTLTQIENSFLASLELRIENIEQYGTYCTRSIQEELWHAKEVLSYLNEFDAEPRKGNLLAKIESYRQRCDKVDNAIGLLNFDFNSIEINRALEVLEALEKITFNPDERERVRKALEKLQAYCILYKENHDFIQSILRSERIEERLVEFEQTEYYPRGYPFLRGKLEEFKAKGGLNNPLRDLGPDTCTY